MNYNLDLAIELYENEKLALESKIINCLEDFEGPDYRLANYHQKALYKVENTLRTLKSYKDVLFHEKERTLSKITRIEKELKKNNSVFPRDYLAESLEEEKSRFEKLNSIPPVDQPDLSETVLDKALSDLIAKKIKRFKLVFDGSKNIFLEFIRSKEIIKITLPNIRHHIKNQIFYESQIEHLRKYGFNLINTNKVQAVIIVQDHQTAYQYIRFLLVKVIFDILYYTGNKDNSYIEF